MTPQQEAITAALDAATGEAYGVACDFIGKRLTDDERAGAAMALVATAIGLLRGVVPNQEMVDGFLSGALEFPVRLPIVEYRGGENPRGIFQ